MPDNSGNMQGVYERIGRNEEAIEGLERRATILESKNESLSRLTVMMEVQTEMNKQQNEQMGKISDSLNNVNNNLTLMNAGQVQLQKDISEQGKRVTDIEKTLDDGKINTTQIVKMVVIAVIVGVVSFIVAATTGIKI